MKIVIVGCGRVGALMAETFDLLGHEVIVIDRVTSAFDRLPASFAGTAIRGDGTDEDVLRRAGAQDADLFLTLTEGDNRNVMAAQLAQESLGARAVIAKVNDPVRAAAYAELGVPTLCRTNLMANAVYGYLGLPSLYPPGIISPATVGAHQEGAPGPLTGAALGAMAARPDEG